MDRILTQRIIHGMYPAVVDTGIEAEKTLKELGGKVSEEDKKKVEELYKPYKDRLALSWGIHPIANPRRFGAITIKDATKREGAMAISKSLGIALENFLGVGDNIMDWDFLELCGFGAAMGNATEELKRYVMGKGDQGYVGKSVDENGIIGIFDHFGF